MEHIVYREYKDRTKSIYNNIEVILKSLNGEMYKKLYDEYEEEFSKTRNKGGLEIGFIGQYSAGKSTIISALTKREDIKIAQGIATSKVTKYDWNDVFLVDTPGISTEKTEHDEMAYKCMDSSDLLIYVVTVNGFDETIAKDFRKIAFENKKISKMMLVVNKTSMEPITNYEYWINDIVNVIHPASPSELRLTVIDANDYISSLEEEDEADKLEFDILSNFNELIGNINSFILEKRINGRLLSPLNVMQTHVNKYIDFMTIDDLNLKKLQELLRQKEFIVNQSKKRLEKKINNVIELLVDEIINKSLEFVSKINADLDKEVLDTDSKLITCAIDRECEIAAEKIDDLISGEVDILLKELQALENSELVKDILRDININFDFKVTIKNKKLNDNFKKLPDIAKGVGKFLNLAGDNVTKWAINAENVGKQGLKVVSGSDAHKTVLDVGHFFGKKFKPYEAQKVAAKFGKFGEKAAKVGKVLGGAQVVLAPAMAILEEYQEVKYENGIKQARVRARDEFYKWAKEVEEKFNQEKNTILNNLHVKELNSIKQQIDELRNTKEFEDSNASSLKDLITLIQELINDIN